VHDNPKQAKSDGANALDLKNLRGVLQDLMAIRKAVTK
jgi:2-dehydro-3-deoxyphosphooctonate aldolase (KDO 8-P synthase)